MKTTYKITEAHSGTDSKEIAKAKKHFRKMIKSGDVWGQITPVINIQFSDINYSINAKFVNQAGQEVCQPAQIN